MTETEMLTFSDRFEAEIFRNPRFDPRSPRLIQTAAFTAEAAAAAFRRISAWPNYGVTPLRRLSDAADRLGLGAIYCKDESARLGLASFKALGALFAAVYEISDLLENRLGGPVSDGDLLAGGYGPQLGNVTLACATDGNHGLSVAHAARKMGCRARIYIPRGVSSGREAGLREEGAEVIRIDGIYEDAVDAVQAAAKSEPDTYIISDYATPDYQKVPARCMMGYAVMAQEIVNQLGDVLPSHFIVPAGCGGLAAAMMSSMHQSLGDRAPRFIVVEPRSADCVFASAAAGHCVRISGDLDTIMGGLACAAVSYVAWPTLDLGAFAFMRMNDQAAVEAMRFFARPRGGDSKLVAGETGAAGMGALLALCESASARGLLGIDRTSRILIINCEGATDPELYRDFVGEGADTALTMVAPLRA